MTDVRELREGLGLSRADFARRYGIPYRTVEDWEAGRRTPAPWALALLERVIQAEKDRNGDR